MHWLKKINLCPICRLGAYRPKHETCLVSTNEPQLTRLQRARTKMFTHITHTTITSKTQSKARLHAKKLTTHKPTTELPTDDVSYEASRRVRPASSAGIRISQSPSASSNAAPAVPQSVPVSSLESIRRSEAEASVPQRVQASPPRFSVSCSLLCLEALWRACQGRYFELDYLIGWQPQLHDR